MSKKKRHGGGNGEGMDQLSEATEVWGEEEGIYTKQVQQEQPKIIVDCQLEGEKVLAWKNQEAVYEPGFYGKQLGDRLELSLVEALLLLKRGRIRVLRDENPMNQQELYDYATKIDVRFPHKYRVYEDLRERGLVVRTGFKFGCDYRVYERGVQLKKGPKSAREHTKWIVFAVPEDFTQSFDELSRAVRLAHNIRARMLWAVVDSESDVTFYQVTRHKP
ncbi:MAG: tRNA-intron lyase [Candidatus Aenigmarchaeota archaeon]|nr:tRNA-intron lyase [Candidatus Aenigmarchaeota archaeon]